MKAQKQVIKYGTIDLEVYMLPDGTYVLSQTQVARAIDKHTKSFCRFLEGKSTKQRLEQYVGQDLHEIDSQSIDDKYYLSQSPIDTAGRPINATPFKIAFAYWSYWAQKDNVKAQAILAAGAEETLTRLADRAFGVQRTEQEYSQALAFNQTQYEQIMGMLQQMMAQNQQVIQQNQLLIQELALLRPAYEELQVLNKSFKELPELKKLLEQIAANIDKPNQDKKTLAEWLKDLKLDSAVSSGQRKGIGRIISDWLKVGNLKPPARQHTNSGKFIYPSAMLPLISLAVQYELFAKPVK